LEHEKRVKIIGLPWQEKDKFNLLSRNSLKSNILCTKHNSLLSPFDAEMGRFFRTIIDNDLNLISKKPNSEISTFCGNDLERWMLKVTCAFIASNQILSQTGKPFPLKDIYLEVLFK
jgi:hypothetical protein